MKRLSTDSTKYGARKTYAYSSSTLRRIVPISTEASESISSIIGSTARSLDYSIKQDAEVRNIQMQKLEDARIANSNSRKEVTLKEENKRNIVPPD